MAAHNKLSILSFELLVQFYHVNFPLELRKGTGQLQLAAVVMVEMVGCRGGENVG